MLTCALQIGTAARTLFNFAEAYGTVAREEHTAQPIPTRLPTEREISDMIGNVDWMRNMLENVRGVVQQSVMNELARERSRSKGRYEDEDVQMHGDGTKPAGYGPTMPSAPAYATTVGSLADRDPKRRRGVSDGAVNFLPLITTRDLCLVC